MPAECTGQSWTSPENIPDAEPVYADVMVMLQDVLGQKIWPPSATHLNEAIYPSEELSPILILS